MPSLVYIHLILALFLYFSARFAMNLHYKGPMTPHVTHTDSSWKLQPYNCKPLICWTQLKQKTPFSSVIEDTNGAFVRVMLRGWVGTCGCGLHIRSGISTVQQCCDRMQCLHD